MALKTGAVRQPGIVIDARAQLDGGPVALEKAHEQPLIEHLLRHVLTSSAGDVAVVAEAEQVESIRATVDDLRQRMNAACRVEVSAYPAPAGSIRLRADTVYDLPRLRRALKAGGDPGREALWRIRAQSDLPRAGAEIARAVDWYPISRWYLRPWARRLARTCGLRGLSANCLTWTGFAVAAAAALTMPLAVNAGFWLQPWARLGAAGLLLGYWLFDQADGYLARLTGTASVYGGWLDANLDELADLALHVAAAGAMAAQTGSVVPLWLVVGFLFGKYLFVYGLNSSERRDAKGSDPSSLPSCGGGLGWGDPGSATSLGRLSALRRLWHLPADADVRLHLLVAAVACGQVGVELAFVAVYYNLRWATRHVLLARRAVRPA